ncbi:MAG: hypothetical protein H0T42_28010 [Deltaproteobacteria bacterium]|nr:hypothetical protein [Deltaproteobacteria bacterium]
MVVLVVGCTTHEPATLTTKRLVGAYDVAYAPVVGAAVDFVRERVVFNSPTTSPGCCLGIWRRTDTTLELSVGNENSAQDVCDPLVNVRVYIDEVLAAAPQKVVLGPTNTRAYLSYSEPKGPPCRRAQDSQAGAQNIQLSGELDLGIFHCADEPDGLGCALNAKGAWTLRSDDDRFSTNGWFESADTVAPLTF